MKLIQRIFLISLCFLFFSSASSQNWIGGMVSTDTLYAGQTNVILMNSGGTVIEHTPHLTCHYIYSDTEKCQGHFEDTIWAVKVEPYNDSIVKLSFDIPAIAYPVDYSIDLTNGMYYYPMRIFKMFFIMGQALNDTICLGGTGTFEVCAISDGSISYQWFHNNKYISRSNSSVLSVENVEFSDTGSYYCMLEAFNDTIYTDTVRLHLKEIPDLSTKPWGPTSVCYTGDPVDYEIEHNDHATAYNWILIPANSGTIEATNNVASISWNPAFTGSTGLLAEISLGGCPGMSSDTLWIDVAGIQDPQEICIVGIDEETDYYRIVWNKTGNQSITHYNIHRESNQAGIFLKLATIPAGDFSVFIDSSSAPDILSHSYKMSSIDTCDNESELGKVHTTIHLTVSTSISGGNNLIWNHYKGFPFLSYEIYRGTHGDSVTLLQSIPSTVSSFTDSDPPVGTIYYRIVVRKSEGCTPAIKSGTDYSISMSNTEKILVSGIPEYNPVSRLMLSPNPASRKVLVTYNGRGLAGKELTLLTLLGQEVGLYKLENEQKEIDLSGFEPGLYLVQIKEEEGVIIQKLVIRK